MCAVQAETPRLPGQGRMGKVNQRMLTCDFFGGVRAVGSKAKPADNHARERRKEEVSPQTNAAVGEQIVLQCIAMELTHRVGQASPDVS